MALETALSPESIASPGTTALDLIAARAVEVVADRHARVAHDVRFWPTSTVSCSSVSSSGTVTMPCRSNSGAAALTTCRCRGSRSFAGVVLVLPTGPTARLAAASSCPDSRHAVRIRMSGGCAVWIDGGCFCCHWRCLPGRPAAAIGGCVLRVSRPARPLRRARRPSRWSCRPARCRPRAGSSAWSASGRTRSAAALSALSMQAPPSTQAK